MVQSIIDVGEKEDRILNIVKAKYGLKNKSQAISIILNIYQESFLEPELRPEFIIKLKKIKKEKGNVFSSIEDLREHLER
ncbi:MAG TPA: DUF2683 family protein [Candidatus Nanoarchaeia archaeon]|nr:DUF2683 family protein [Candidatus Nanoarchaeia archaeon]